MGVEAERCEVRTNCPSLFVMPQLRAAYNENENLHPSIGKIQKSLTKVAALAGNA